MVMRRVKLPFVPGVEIEFVDRGRGLSQVIEWGERGTRFPVVVFGPEGCGKTSWLKQSIVVLRDLGYDVIYLNPLRRDFLAEIDVRDLGEVVAQIVRDVVLEHAIARAVWGVISLAREVVRMGRGRLAVLVDDAFQLIGVKESAFLVKGLLELIEHPPASYDRIVAIVATSEGLSRGEIGRHRWAYMRPMWNMSRGAFEELYDRIPGPKPDFNAIWTWTGGNPDMLAKLYQAGWNVERVIVDLANMKGVTAGFVGRWRAFLDKAIENPDILWEESVPGELVEELITKNLIVFNVYNRDPWFWVDEPPPIRDPELGIGEHVAWQTPLHREAIRMVIHKKS